MIRLSMERISVFWETGEPTAALTRAPEGQSDATRVLGARFRADGLVRLRVRLKDPGLAERTGARVDALELLHIDANGSKAPARVLEGQPAGTDLRQDFTAEFRMADLLELLATQVNRNLVEARVVIRGRDLETAAFLSSNLLHLALQHIIVFIPGVCGSKISVASHPDENSFPAWSVTGIPRLDEFGRMRCDAFGSPEPGAEAVRVDLFDKFEPIRDTPRVPTVGDPTGDLKKLQAEALNLIATQTIYNVMEQKPVLEPIMHPELRDAGGKRFRHYLMVPWPYDWRLRLEFAVSALLGRDIPETAPEPGEGKRNHGVKRPSIKDMLAAHKAAMPLLADKAVLAGHSTGGVIMKRLLAEPDAKDLVSRANFINVPFFGAPKAYFVFLTGRMLPIIDADLLQNMAPRLPIVYYLAPTESFEGKVAVITEFNTADKVFERRKGQDVGAEFMRTLVKNMGDRYKAPASMGGWNSFLERKANAYARNALKEPVIGLANCRIFFSQHFSGGAEATPGHVRNLFTAPKDISHAVIPGDGTVPRMSLLAGLSETDDRVSKTPGGPAHDAAANSPSVWIQVVNDLIGL